MHNKSFAILFVLFSNFDPFSIYSLFVLHSNSLWCTFIPYFEKITVSLCDLQAVYVCDSPCINF
jgi:hypothetical protein